MVKSELVEVLINRQPHLLPRDVELAVNCMLEQMTASLEAGERIEIRGFGSFDLRQRPERSNGRNPKTGETVQVAAKTKIHFKPGKEMRDRVDASRDQCQIKD
jgi:integration host factor subunit beta